MAVTTVSSQTPPPATHPQGKRMLQIGLVVHGVITLERLVLAWSMSHDLMVNVIGGLLWLAIVGWLMVKTLRGSENCKLALGLSALSNATGAFCLFLADVVLVAALPASGKGPPLYALAALLYFSGACYCVRAFLINQEVKDHVATLAAARKAKGELPTAPRGA